MRRAIKRIQILLLAMLCTTAVAPSVAQTEAVCSKPVYLTFDTGHMGVADLVANVLKRHDVQVTFFMANERTLTGGTSLDDEWADWWRARASEGHAFASHTYDHVYWLSDLDGARFRMRATFGPEAGKRQTWAARQYCEELDRVGARWTQMTGQTLMPLFRAPGGKTSAALIKTASQCGYQHVGWSRAGFLGDELPSEKFSNQRLLDQALRDIRPDDILMAHLGIWSRKDPWAPAVLEPLIVGLKARGFCFRTLAQHPQYGQSNQTRHGS